MDINTTLSTRTQNQLLASAGWARYAAILSFVGVGLGLLQIVVGLIKGDASIMTAFMSFSISAIISIVMAVNLMKFSTLSKESLAQRDAHRLDVALSHLKTYFVIMGVLFIIAISLLVLGLLIGILVAAASL